MKKFYTVILMALISSAMFAQVTINSENYYKPGAVARDLYLVENDATDAVGATNVLTTPLVFGNNLETVFPNFNITDSVIYHAPENSIDFQTETCSFADENGMRMHLCVTNENATCLGVSGALAQLGLTDNMNVVFDEPMLVTSFPIVYNTEIHSNGHGVYNESISALQGTFNQVGGGYGAMIYNMVAAQYDSIRVDIAVVFNSTFDEAATLTLAGQRMQQGEYPYLRENRNYTYTTNVYLREIASNNYVNLNDCEINGIGAVGPMLSAYMGLEFPMINTTTALNYWIADDNYPIVEMTTNEDNSGIKRLAIRYGENPEPSTIDSNDINVAIFPNPATDYINIAIEGMENGSIQIYSANGSLVSEKALNGNFNSINVSSLKAGNYLYTITSGDKRINGKFAKN